MNDESFTSSDGTYSLFMHQQIIRDYINIYSPYRGLLLYHGLGAGKTCGSIGIAEGLKHADKKIMVLTPASLRRNFFSELKKCGDPLYKTNQYWEFISTTNNPHLEKALSEILALDIQFINKNKERKMEVDNYHIIYRYFFSSLSCWVWTDSNR